MKRSLAAAGLAAMFVTTAIADARDDDYDRRRDRYGYSRDGGSYGNSRDYGWSGQRGGAGIIDRTLANLQRAASRNRVDGHERDHFRRAISELQQLRYRRNDGRLDERRLDRAIEDLQHLSNARQIHPSDRQLLARDMHALRDLRYSRDGYYRR